MARPDEAGWEELTVDRLSPTDAGFYYAESEDTPLHVGSVAVF
jgi:diacylglycerol O-acyltransferase / wax synthase